jgi:hypothetical protein
MIASRDKAIRLAGFMSARRPKSFGLPGVGCPCPRLQGDVLRDGLVDAIDGMSSELARQIARR